VGVVKQRERRLELQRDALTIMTPGLVKPRDPNLMPAQDVRVGRYGPSALTAAGVTLCTVPAGRVFVIKSIEVANVLGGAGRLRLDIQSSGNKMLEHCPLPSYETMTIPLAYPLLAGEVLRGYNMDDVSTALHAVVYVLDMPRWYFDAFGGMRGITQQSSGAGDLNIINSGGRDALITMHYAGAIEANTVVRTPQFGPGPHKYFALPQGAWATQHDPYHLPSNSNLTFRNIAGGWCTGMVAGLNGIEF
jgi:hypothetical protein